MDLFLPDKLHLINSAYVKFAEILKPALEAAWERVK